jgi:hypothetical protein
VGVWWQQVAAQFEEAVPPLLDVAVHGLERPVLALHFESGQAPFVVRNPLHGSKGNVVEREVPWREGTQVRTATRADMLRVLMPPDIQASADIIRGNLVVQKPKPGQRLQWRLDAVIYLTSPVGSTFVVPDHLCEGYLTFAGEIPPKDMRISLVASSTPFPVAGRVGSSGERVFTIRQGDGQVIVDGPGFLSIYGLAEEEFDPDSPPPLHLADPLGLDVRLRPAGGQQHIQISCTLRFGLRERPAGVERPLGEWSYSVPPQD